jgi:hypothetical protein
MKTWKNTGVDYELIQRLCADDTNATPNIGSRMSLMETFDEIFLSQQHVRFNIYRRG